MAGIGATVSKGLKYLKKRGIRKTLRKTALHIDRKRLERQYARRMMPGEEELAAQRRTVFDRPPRFSVVVPLYNTPMALLREMTDSVAGQSYENWELCLADGSDGEHGEVGEYCRERAAADSRIRYRKLEKNEGISGNSNAAMGMAAGDYIALLDHDDLLMPNALYEMAKTIQETGADFLYSDEMIFFSPKVSRIAGIRFKPDFAPEDLLTNNYICHLTVFRRKLLERTEGFRPDFDGSQDHDLVLRLTAAAGKVVHVPKVLYLWRAVKGSVAADIHMKEYAIGAGRRAVESFLRDRGRADIRVESTEVFPTMYRLRWKIAGEPTVRILLDVTRERGDWPARLRRLKEKTGWKKCVWEPVGGDAWEAETAGAGKRQEKAGNLGRIDTGNVDTGAEPMGAFAPGNLCRRDRLSDAAQRAGEDYLLFLDGVPEAMNPDWVEEMLMWAQEKEIGAVGAKMRFAGGTDLRHAGIILGLGTEGAAGRPYFEREDDLVGFFGQLAVTRTVSAVTDCWMVRREKFLEAGGFDGGYREALFDIDLCLKLREKGYRNLWTPYACLAGGEAKDFFLDVGKEYPGYKADREAFRTRWAEVLRKGDPCYNPNLSLRYEDWRIDEKRKSS